MAITLENRKQKTETGKRPESGFALLVAVIFMSVMLTFGVTLGSLAYKQQVLASTAVESQYAFYVADAALECALYEDQQLNFFAFPATQPASAPLMTCDGISATFSPAYPTGIVSYIPLTKWVITERLSLDSNKRCADITVYKPAQSSGTTYIFSQGYNVSCDTVANPGGVRFVSRGLNAHY